MFKSRIQFTIILCAFLFSTLSNAQDPDAATNSEGIIFIQKPFKELKELAKAQNKMIFMDAYASWCGPCKKMAREIFPLQEVATFYNTNFICAKIDMEKGEGIEIAKLYAVRNYPTYLFINGDGELMHRALGSKPADEFITDAKNALDPDKQLIGKIKKVRANPGNATSVYELFQMQDEIAVSPDSIVLKLFIDQVNNEQMTDQLTYKIVNEFGSGLDSKSFKLQNDNYQNLVKAFSKDSVDKYFIKYIHRNLTIYAKRGGKTEYPKFKTEMQALKNIQLNEKEIWLTDIAYYKHIKDIPGLEKTYLNGTEKYCWDDAYMLNSVAWTLFEKSTDKNVLLSADKFISRGLELNENGSYLDTRANILFKLGNKAEAKKIAEKAIKMLKEEGQDYSETQELLMKIEKTK